VLKRAGAAYFLIEAFSDLTETAGDNQYAFPPPPR